MELGKVRVRVVPDSNVNLNYLQPLPDDDVDTRARKQGRLDAFERGDWLPVGIVADARVGLRFGTAKFQSLGKWGVESDSPTVIAVIKVEQLDGLRDVLVEVFGRDASGMHEAIDAAIAEVKANLE